MSSLISKAISTRIFRVGEDLVDFLRESIEKNIASPSGLEGSILAVTSKIVSLSEGRVLPKNNCDKENLVKRESDTYLGEIGYGCYLTIKHGLFIASAGIDESNSEDDAYILYPEDPFMTAETIRRDLARAWGLRQLGIVMTDSHTSPLRAGVSGVALAHAGFRGVRSKIGCPDLFGRPLKMTQINVADALAGAAVFCMGEANESAPLAILKADVEFILEPDVERRREECIISPEKDLYSPLYFDKLI